ncbi:hypothetical protein [Corynebacterium ciconiae]|uniref:hypothetical protein n=1 Tax=Corynebacterium ciconiae TaxID=227319 RepID=UPI0012E9BFA0|nr:hypothetical protein [Corynebacterium ciconiae]
MTDLTLNPAHARSLIHDLLSAAAATSPATASPLSPTPGMERFAAALHRATTASGERSLQLARCCERRAEDTAGHLSSIELVDADLAAWLDRQV